MLERGMHTHIKVSKGRFRMTELQQNTYVSGMAPKPTPLDTGKEVVAQVIEDDVPGLAAEISYHVVFSLAPLLIFIISLAAIVDHYTGVDVSGELVQLINEHAPSAEAESVLNQLVENAITESSGGLASVGALTSLLVALWSGSNAVNTLMKAFNRAYDVDEQRTFIKAKGLAVLLTLGLGMLLIISFVLFLFGGDIGEFVADEFGLAGAFLWIWNIVRYLLAVAFLMFVLSLLYYFGPNLEQPFKFVTPGSISAALLWFVMVFLFQIYVTYANPGSAYGVFGGLIVLMLFFFITGVVFLLGAEINAVLARQITAVDATVSPNVVLPSGKVTAETAEPDSPGASRKTRSAAIAAAGIAALLVMANKVRSIRS